MASTLMPFLYQTRTMAGFRAMGLRKVFAVNITNPKSFHSGRQFASVEDPTSERSNFQPLAPVDDQGSAFDTTDPISFQSDHEPTNSEEPASGLFNFHPLPSTEVVEPETIYEGSPYKRQPRNQNQIFKFNTQYTNNGNLSKDIPPEGQRRRRRFDLDEIINDDENRPKIQEGIPFEEDGEDSKSFELLSASDPMIADRDIFSKANDVPEQLQEPIDLPATKFSTITSQERETFRKIFADIQLRSIHPSDLMLETKPQLSQGITTGQPTTRQEEDAEKSLFGIMQKASANARKKQEFTLKSKDELLKNVEKYPQPLRAAAAKALGLVREKETDGDESGFKSQELENLRQPEFERVEKMMRNASTDLKLWAVMEKEVFSLPRKLGFEAAPEVKSKSSTPPNTKSKSKSKTQSKENLESATTTGEKQTPELNLSVHGPLYPSYLLLGLRLLDSAFAKPSSLSLNVLPRIKSLGLISLALGGSTALYNELIRIMWLRYDNYRGVDDLLVEMDKFGLEFDAETLDVVTRIDVLQNSVGLGKYGRTVQILWRMPEFAPGSFLSWKRKIEVLLRAKQASNKVISSDIDMGPSYGQPDFLTTSKNSAQA